MVEHAYVVAARSTAIIARAAEEFLVRCSPDHLASGRPLDVAHLVDYGLQREGIHVYAVSHEELPDAEAETRAAVDGSLEIWMREDIYGALFERNSRTVRARSTLAHEVGHAVLHKVEVRTGRNRPELLTLRRAPRNEIPQYRDSEWQAHAFAGALLLPRPALRVVDLNDTYAIGAQFDVSEAFARSHVKRIRRCL